MRKTDWGAVAEAAGSITGPYLESLDSRSVWRAVPHEQAKQVLGGPLPEESRDPAEVVAELGRALEPMVNAHASGRFFGFVIGGLHPASYGAELLNAAFDQNAGLYEPIPGAAMAEEVAAGWIVDLLDLPSDAGVGFVTGGQMASFTCLAAARDHVLRAAGWDVEANGLHGAPKVNLVTKAESHSTIGRAFRYLGLGERTATMLPVDDDDRLSVAALADHLAAVSGPTIVCIEAGNVNTGAFDPFEEIADVVDAHRDRGNPTWVHVDGAVGLWARAGSRAADLTGGIERLDSWSTDAHKLLNVSYDSGIAITRHVASHVAAMSVHASYLVHAQRGERDPMDFNPEFSRRARGVAVYATLASLGRTGVRELVDRVCGLAQRFAAGIRAGGIGTVRNGVAFNQVLVAFETPGSRNPDEFCDAVISTINREGEAYFSGTTWRGRRHMRISVSDWATDESDVDRALAAIERALARVRDG